MKRTSAFLLMFTLGFSLFTHAQTRDVAAAKAPAPGPSMSEEEVKRKARYREYPGGRDEEPIKLVPQLSAPIRSHNQTAEAAEPQEESND